MSESKVWRRRTLRLVWAVGAIVSVVTACSLESAPSAYRPDALYRRYCASCHGLSGTGDGPVAEVLAVKPADLTQLTEKDGGTELVVVAKVERAINGHRPIRAHGEKDMPVWGEFFAEELRDSRISSHPHFPKALAIAKYVATQLQQKPTG